MKKISLKGKCRSFNGARRRLIALEFSIYNEAPKDDGTYDQYNLTFCSDNQFFTHLELFVGRLSIRNKDGNKIVKEIFLKEKEICQFYEQVYEQEIKQIILITNKLSALKDFI